MTPERRQPLRAAAARAVAREVARAVAFAAICAAAAAARPVQAADAGLPQARATPGGVLLVPLGPAAARPSAWQGDVPVLVTGDTAGWTLVLLWFVHLCLGHVCCAAGADGVPLLVLPGLRVAGGLGW